MTSNLPGSSRIFRPALLNTAVVFGSRSRSKTRCASIRCGQPVFFASSRICL